MLLFYKMKIPYYKSRKLLCINHFGWERFLHRLRAIQGLLPSGTIKKDKEKPLWHQIYQRGFSKKEHYFQSIVLKMSLVFPAGILQRNLPFWGMISWQLHLPILRRGEEANTFPLGLGIGARCKAGTP